jgi:hypothetical protein
VLVDVTELMLAVEIGDRGQKKSPLLFELGELIRVHSSSSS